MSTSITLRINDELEMNLKRTLRELKTSTPKGAEVNNSTIVRGALVDFLKRLENEKNGEKRVAYNFKKLSYDEVRSIDIMLDKIIKNLDKECPSYPFIWNLLTEITTEVLYELIERKKEIALRGEF